MYYPCECKVCEGGERITWRVINEVMESVRWDEEWYIEVNLIEDKDKNRKRARETW